MGSQAQPSEPNPPRRITGRVGGLSIRRQRDLLQLIKERRAEPESSPSPRRQRSAPAQEQVTAASLELAILRDARERQLSRIREEQKAEEEAAFLRSRHLLKSALLLVDAYNIMHQWPKCAELVVGSSSSSLASARDLFTREMGGYAAFRSLRVVLVFDAASSRLKEVQRERVSSHLELVYSAGESGTADEFIQGEVRALLADAQPPLVYVASNDMHVRDISAGWGAILISAEQLIANVEKTDEEAHELLQRNRSRGAGIEGRRVLARLDSRTGGTLLALRNQLNEKAKRQGR